MSVSGQPSSRARAVGWERAALFGGVVMLLLLIISSLLPGGANSNDPPAAILKYYQEQHASDLVSDYVSFIATLPFIAFVAGFASAAMRIRGDLGALIVVLVATAIVGFGFELAATAIEIALASGGYALTDAGVVAILFWVASRLFYISVLLLGCFMGTAAITGWTFVPFALRWGAATVAAFLLVGSLAISAPHGPLGSIYLIGYALMGLWMAATAVYLSWPMRSPRSPVTASRM